MPSIMVSLNEQQVRLLEGEGMFASPYQTRRGLMHIIQEGEVQRALDLLGLTVGECGNSGLEGIDLVTLVPNNGRAQAQGRRPGTNVNVADVRLVGPEMQGYPVLDALSRVIQSDFVPTLGRKVVVHPAGGKRSEPLNDGDFHIHLFSSPRGERRFNPPGIMFGTAVTSRAKSYRPSGTGTPIAAPEGDWAAAELVDDSNLYVHHDIMDGGDDDARILQRILQEALRLLDLRPAPEAAVLERRMARQGERDAARTAYTEACSGRLKDELASLEARVEETRQEAENLRRQLTTTQQGLNQAQARLDGIRTGNAEALERFGKEFDTLISHPKVKDVRVEGGVVKVFTTLLCVRDPRSRKLHEIGEFRIELSTGGRGGVRWFNLTRRIDGGRSGMQAPHVTNDGNACLGNTAETFPTLIANFEFAQAAFMAIEFVESVNVDDGWGQHVNRWPLAREQDPDNKE